MPTADIDAVDRLSAAGVPGAHRRRLRRWPQSAGRGIVSTAACAVPELLAALGARDCGRRRGRNPGARPPATGIRALVGAFPGTHGGEVGNGLARTEDRAAGRAALASETERPRLVSRLVSGVAAGRQEVGGACVGRRRARLRRSCCRRRCRRRPARGWSPSGPPSTTPSSRTRCMFLTTSIRRRSIRWSSACTPRTRIIASTYGRSSASPSARARRIPRICGSFRARDAGFIVAAPLARGSMDYRGIAERDVYDMLADVERRFPDRPRPRLSDRHLDGRRRGARGWR